MAAPLRLSQDAYLLGLTCLRALNFHYESPGFPAGPEPGAPAAEGPSFPGSELLNLARRLYPGGGLVEARPWTEEALAQTEALIRSGEPIFGAAARTPAGDFAAADILRPRPGGFELIAVSADTEVTDRGLHGLAFQYHVFSQKHTLRRALLLTVNPGYVRRGELEPAKLFKLHILTAPVQALAAREPPGRLAAEFERRRAGFQHGAKKPGPGPHCYLHGGCPYREPCWRRVHRIPAYSLFDVLEDKKEAARLYQLRESADLDRFPDLALPPRQQAEADCWRRQGRLVRPKELKLFLERLRGHLSLLDYEIIRPPWPLFPGSRPYEPIPVRYNVCHAHARLTGTGPEWDIGGHWFTVDLMPEAAAGEHVYGEDTWESLLYGLPIYLDSYSEPILVWNKALVVDLHQRAARSRPGQARTLRSHASRLVEMEGLFRARALYDYRQFGAEILPVVYEAFTGQAYGDLEPPKWVAMDIHPAYAPFTGRDGEGVKPGMGGGAGCSRRVLAMLKILTAISRLTT